MEISGLFSDYNPTIMAQTSLGCENMFEAGVVRANEC